VGNIAHSLAIVSVADPALLVHDHLGGHPPQLEEVDFLSVQLLHTVFGVGRPDERQLLLRPVRRKGHRILPGPTTSTSASRRTNSS
jgi:hypothetical protein